ncbi:MAG: alpha/beta fold hydrolase [Acidimicrobiia bacterium]
MSVDDWRARGRNVATANGDVFVVEESGRRAGDGEGEGEGEPVLVLHGFPTSSHDWDPVLPALASRGPVVLFDFPGYGLSTKPDRAYSLFDQADTVEELASHLGLTSVVLVTHDMGDSVGGELLARSLDGTLSFDVSRRVLTNGSIYLDLAQLTDGQKMLESLPDAALPEGAGPDVTGLAAALRATFAPDAIVSDEDLLVHAELIAHEGGNRLLPRLIRYLGERRVHEARWTGAIERHGAPLTIVWGDLDPIAVWPMAERLHATRPDAGLVRLDGLGHYPMLEDPARFAKALTDALG